MRLPISSYLTPWSGLNMPGYAQAVVQSSLVLSWLEVRRGGGVDIWSILGYIVELCYLYNINVLFIQYLHDL